MSKVIALCNLKGGVGKSTCAVNLACELANDRTRVVIVDVDAGQGSSRLWARAGQLPVEVRPLPLVDRRDAAGWSASVEELRRDHDHVVLDCPPQLGAASTAAMLIADLVLIPVTPSAVDLQATAAALRMLDEVRVARGGNGTPSSMLVPSMVDRRTTRGREVRGALATHFPRVKIGPSIGFRSVYVDAASTGQWVGQVAPRSSKARGEITELGKAIRRMLR